MDENERDFFQGAQTGRAVRMVNTHRNGIASAGIVLDCHVLTVFAHCTPLDTED